MHDRLDEALLTADEAAAILRVRTGTIYRWVGQGRIPCVRLGRRMTRFRRSDLDLFIQSHTALGGGEYAMGNSGSIMASRAVDGPEKDALDATS